MDQESHRQLLLQQMLRQQNPLMGQQMIQPGVGLGGAQFFGQQALQNQGQLNPGQHGQHTQQPGAMGAGFQQTQIGGQINPLFHQNANPLFQQHQQMQSNGSQGQTGQHHAQISAQTSLQKPQVQSGLIPGQIQQNQSQHLLGGAQTGILGQIGGGIGGSQGQQPGNPLLLGNMMQLQQQIQQQQQMQNQQQQQQQQQTQNNPSQQSSLQGFSQAQGNLGQLPFQQLNSQLGGGQNQLAAYLNKFQDMQAQSNQPNTQDNQGLKNPQNQNQGIYGHLQGQNQMGQNQNAEQPQNPSLTNQQALNPNATNIHQLNFLGQLQQPSGQQNIGQNPPSLNPQIQFFGQNFPNQMQNQNKLGQMGPNGVQNPLQGANQQQVSQPKPQNLGQLTGQLGQQSQNQPGMIPHLQSQNSLGLNQPQLQQQQMMQNNQQQIPTLNPAAPRTGANLQGTGLAGAAMQAEKNLQMQSNNQQQQQLPGSLPNIQGMNPGQNNQMMNVANLNKLAEYCATNGEYHHAIEYYQQLTTLDPDNGPAWTALGHCYLLIEDLQKSFNAYQHALYSLEDIKDPQLWYGIGILYEKFESYDHAISALIAVLKMSPNFYQKSEVLYKLGIIFAKTNQIEQGISYFQNSILTNTFTVKRKVDTLLKIGLLYEENKDYTQAQRSYEAALNHDDNNYKIYQHLAWSYFLQGNINNALEFIKKADKKNKGQADSFYIQGRCFMCLENTKEALENFQQAAYKNPGEAVYWATLAIFYYNTANYTDAFENIIKATTLNPQMSEIWYNLGVLYEKCRQPEEALIAYSKVLELDNDEQDAQKRIMAIKNPQYQNDQNKNQINLQMKYPKFTLPNSLMILRKYKKSNPNQKPVTTGNEQLQNPLESQLQQSLGQLPGNLGQGQNLLGQLRPQEINPNLLNGQNLQTPGNMGDANKLTLPGQPQFQGQQPKLEDNAQNPSFGGLSAFNTPQGLQNQNKIGGLTGLPNPDNMVNKLSEIHSILKPPQGPSGLNIPQATTPNQNILNGLGQQLQGNMPQGGTTNGLPQLNVPQNNQGFQQLNQNIQQQPTMINNPQNLPAIGQVHPTQMNPNQIDTNQVNQQQAPSSDMINIQKTNLNQILSSLPQNINLSSLSRDDLLSLLQDQQMTQKANEAQVNQIVQQQQQQLQQQNNDQNESQATISAPKIQEEAKNDLIQQQQQQVLPTLQADNTQQQQDLVQQAQQLPQQVTPNQTATIPNLQNLVEQQQQQLNQITTPQSNQQQIKIEDSNNILNDLVAQQQKLLAQNNILPTMQANNATQPLQQLQPNLQNLAQMYNPAFLSQLQSNPELQQAFFLQQQQQQQLQQQIDMQNQYALQMHQAQQLAQQQQQQQQQQLQQTPVQKTENQQSNSPDHNQQQQQTALDQNAQLLNNLQQLQAAQAQAQTQLEQQQTPQLIQSNNVSAADTQNLINQQQQQQLDANLQQQLLQQQLEANAQLQASAQIGVPAQNQESHQIKPQTICHADDATPTTDAGGNQKQEGTACNANGDDNSKCENNNQQECGSNSCGQN